MQNTIDKNDENVIIDLNLGTDFNVTNSELIFFRKYLESVEGAMNMKAAKCKNNDIIDLIKVSIAHSKAKVLLGEYERGL